MESLCKVFSTHFDVEFALEMENQEIIEARQFLLLPILIKTQDYLKNKLLLYIIEKHVYLKYNLLLYIINRY